MKIQEAIEELLIIQRVYANMRKEYHPCVEALQIAIEALRTAEQTDETSCNTCRYGEVDEGYVRCAYYSKSTEQTEPSSSEKPNNCKTCKYGEDKHRYAHICNECGVGINNYEPKTEPTGYNLTPVEDKPQTDIHDLTDCDFCKDRNCKDCEGGKDEPQTDCAWK